MANVYDIVGQLTGNVKQAGKASDERDGHSTEADKGNFNSSAKSYYDYLKSIDQTLKQILKSGGMSQSAARDRVGYDRDDPYDRYGQGRRIFQQRYSQRFSRGRDQTSRYDRYYDRYQKSRRPQSFSQGVQEGILEGVLGNDFRKNIHNSFSKLSDQLGVNIADIPGLLGKNLTKVVMNTVKNGGTLPVDISNLIRSVGGVFKGAGKELLSGNLKAAASRLRNGAVDVFNDPNTQSVLGDLLRDGASEKDSSNSEDENQQYRAARTHRSTVEQEPNTDQTQESAQQGHDAAQHNPVTSDIDLIVSEMDRNTTRIVDALTGAKPNQTSPNEGDRPDKQSQSEASNKKAPPEDSSAAEEAANKFNEVSDAVNKANEMKRLAESSSSSADVPLLPESTKDATEAADIANQALNATSNNTALVPIGEAAGEAGNQIAVSNQALNTTTGLIEGGEAAGAAAGATAEAGIALAEFVPYILIAIVAFELLSAAIAPAIEGFKKLGEGLKKAGNRYNESRKKALEEANKRFREDINSMIEEPKEILVDAAKSVESAWDSALQIITATQGYNKSDVQDLMASYADRIQREGLTAYISGADVTENLSKVLEKGLSGTVAEEFAYIATVLNAAVPTQDFFQYAESYASIAANAIRNGASQEQAIQQADNALEEFANNILYASRQLAGGFSTGLQDAASLFSESVKIAQASKTGSIGNISGVLASVSAIVGAIAPDLASSITDAVIKAATGGNSSDIVALRSLAGINASNTEFLQMLANDPQSVFVALFKNLSKMQHMSDGAYMEVAEGVSSVFGMSMDAFARVDFDYLADAINSMDVDSSALAENIENLKSGQTTLTSQQLRNQQINKYMFEEGLAYVLDNEVARSIQEHMWDEQLALQMQEATYGVELQGAALEFLEGIKQSINNIINILNPFAWIGKIVNMVGTAAEVGAQEADIRQLLELGKIGEGNSEAFYQLTNRGFDLHAIPNILEMMGGTSNYKRAHDFLSAYNSMLANPTLSRLDAVQNIASNMDWSTNGTAKDIQNKLQQLGLGATNMFFNPLQTLLQDFGLGAASSMFGGLPRPSSKYDWGVVGKKSASIYQLLSQTISGGLGTVLNTAATVSNTASSVVQNRIDEMLDPDYIRKNFVDQGKSYEDWVASAKNHGIADWETAISDAGYTETQLRGYFEQQETAKAKDEQLALVNDEQEFRDAGRVFWQETFPVAISEQVAPALSLLDEDLKIIIQNQDMLYNLHEPIMKNDETGLLFSLNKRSEDFYTKWVSYYVDKAYARDWADYESIKQQEKEVEGSGIFALAEALTSGMENISDPTMQTNALLSKILLVVQAIMQQNNMHPTTIADTLSGMATGQF